MYVRMITFQAKPDVTLEDARRIYDKIMQLLCTCEGFAGSSLMWSEETRGGLSLTYWHDHDAADRAGEVSLPILLEDVGELVEAPPVITGFDVIDFDVQPAS